MIRSRTWDFQLSPSGQVSGYRSKLGCQLLRGRVELIRVNQNSCDGFDFDWKSGFGPIEKKGPPKRQSGRELTDSIAQFGGLEDQNIPNIQSMNDLRIDS